MSGFNNIASSLFMVLTCLLPAITLWAIAPTGFRLSVFKVIRVNFIHLASNNNTYWSCWSRENVVKYVNLS